ncbi:MAG: DUF1501 domain-containing protein [Candidatus Kapabacteria bacterium]|nr:DUF1501 domain-containing protein [Candidatus Kapabacteria bacterium]
MKKSNYTRRDFLKISSLVPLPLLISGFPISALSSSGYGAVENENDKILVLIQLNGGNDGLSTIFHADQYANLQTVRNNIIVPENTIINFHKEYGFHPSLTGMKEVWDTENLGIIQNVGYPNQNRSHFRSTDIWNTATSAEEFDNKGWIGRYYDLNYSDYPNGYPNSTNPHPFALTFGKIVSATCQGVNTNYSLSLLDPFNPGNAYVSAGGETPQNCYGNVLSYVNDTVAQTNAFATVIQDAANSGNNQSTKWESLETELAKKLKNVARLISGGLKTKIYIVQIGGFDTHDNQVVENETTTGIHTELLKELSDAVCAFQDDLSLLQVSNRVVGMTYSEFGRRIRSNSALGTDHGTAAPMFLFGSCIENQILGDHPEIDTQVGIEDGVQMQFDFRDIYATILKDWLGVNLSNIQSVLHPEIQILPLFKSGCITSTSIHQQNSDSDIQLQLYPNPESNLLNIEFSANSGQTYITVFDSIGGVVAQQIAEVNSPTLQRISIDIANYATGSYFIHIKNKTTTKSKKFIKN